MKIKSFKKFIRSILIILGMSIITVLLIGKASYSSKNVEYRRICVSQGDTLWNIAKSNQSKNLYYKGKDIRYIVNDLIKINNLENSNLDVNQKLIIPFI